MTSTTNSLTSKPTFFWNLLKHVTKVTKTLNQVPHFCFHRRTNGISSYAHKKINWNFACHTNKPLPTVHMLTLASLWLSINISEVWHHNGHGGQTCKWRYVLWFLKFYLHVSAFTPSGSESIDTLVIINDLPFSALTMLVGWQEGHQACKVGCWWWRFDWNFAGLIAPVVITTTTIPSSNEIQNGDNLVSANTVHVDNWR